MDKQHPLTNTTTATMEESELKSLTINQLRRLSTQLGVSGAGKKVDLIERIIFFHSQQQQPNQASEEDENHVEPSKATITENRIDDDVNVICFAVINEQTRP